MARSRYWKITPDEVAEVTYDTDRLLNWEIKCTRAPDRDAIFIGVFMYRHGTPLDYTSIKGIVYYHNHIEKSEIPKITRHLRTRYGGKETRKGDRVFLVGSKEIYEPAELASLARSMEKTFNTKSVITLEFDGLTQDQLRAAGLPDSKLLPIPST